MGATPQLNASSSAPPADARSGAPRARHRQWAAALIANLAAVCAGTAVSWSAPVLLVLQGEEEDVGAWAGSWTHTLVPPRALTEAEGALVASLVPLGALVGALPAGVLVHLLGMRRPLLALAGLFAVGWALILLAGPGGVGLMLAGRAVHGVATGAATVLVPRYCDEVAEVAIRGALGALLDLSICNGVLLIYVMALGLPYALLTIISALVPMIFAITFYFMPESPVHLARSGYRKEALEALAWLRPGWSTSALEAELATLTAEDDEPSEDLTKLSVTAPPSLRSATPPPPLYEDVIAQSEAEEQPPPPFPTSPSETSAPPSPTLSSPRSLSPSPSPSSQPLPSLPPSSHSSSPLPSSAPSPVPSPSPPDSTPPPLESVRRRSPLLPAASHLSPHLLPPPSPLSSSQSQEVTSVPTSSPPTPLQPNAAGCLPPLLKQRGFSYITAKGIFIAYSLMFLQQAAAISAVIAYSTKIFTDAGGSLSPRVATVVLGALQSATGVVAAATVERAGRRPLLVGSAVVVGASLAALAAASADAVPWLPPVALGVYIGAFELGLGPLPWFITAELVGPAAGGGAVAINWATAAVVTETFPSLSKRFGQRSVFAAFGVMAGLAAIFSLFLVPETRGKTRAQLREELKRWPRRAPRRVVAVPAAPA